MSSETYTMHYRASKAIADAAPGMAYCDAVNGTLTAGRLTSARPDVTCEACLDLILSKEEYKAPAVTSHPVLQTVVFHVKDCPPIRGPWKGAAYIFADKVVVEKRPRGVRFVVFGRTRKGERRSVIFNNHGYEKNQPAPNWLRILWEGVRDEHGIR